MFSRFLRFPVVIGITLVLLVSLAIFFLGGASVSGGQLLEYPEGEWPSDERYAIDEEFLVAYFESAGFQRLTLPNMPPHLPRRPVPEGFGPSVTFDFPIKYAEPISLRIYRDPNRSGFWISTEARHPTWAVPTVKAALKKLGEPLVSAWKSHQSDPASFR